ncbi:hypothetical protein EST38_g11384 [Candolleomyces aberdarensis]|uniref:Ima1 N-terminal domain-containing protein n=1 Tax=Candolleomyces aberdarensis TaxID=2316362 RepID=A0A4Q2D500_9AGAR|nr:hypothetical protein EST38_g11384 [Candolleomyces aberdarensis]
MNLLSNYLPAPESSEYAYRVKMLPEYKESLYTRYPPVCELCQPAVEDEIHQKEQMARRKALGGWLKEGKERKRRVSGTPQSKEKVLVETLSWKVRGVLWFLCSVASIVLLSMGMFGRQPLESVPRLRSALPFLVLVSLLWTVWDPTYITIQRARMQGRDVRLHGRRDYIICQMAAWVSRLLVALTIVFHRRSPFLERYVISYPRFYLPLALMFELIALFAYSLCLSIQHPPPIRLIDTQSHRNTLSRSSTPATASQSSLSTPTAPSFPKVLESDLLASLSLSSKPVVTPPPKPVFGLPSLLSQTAGPSSIPAPSDEDAMDWTPTNGDQNSLFGAKSKQKQNDADDGSWLRPQRFFAPEKPTGLEGLFARTKLVDDDAMRVDDEPNPQSRDGILKRWKQWTPILVIASCLPLAFYAGTEL